LEALKEKVIKKEVDEQAVYLADLAGNETVENIIEQIQAQAKKEVQGKNDFAGARKYKKYSVLIRNADILNPPVIPKILHGLYTDIEPSIFQDKK
jgi:hypothetical protein